MLDHFFFVQQQKYVPYYQSENISVSYRLSKKHFMNRPSRPLCLGLCFPISNSFQCLLVQFLPDLPSTFFCQFIHAVCFFSDMNDVYNVHGIPPFKSYERLVVLVTYSCSSTLFQQNMSFFEFKTFFLKHACYLHLYIVKSRHLISRGYFLCAWLKGLKSAE